MQGCARARIGMYAGHGMHDYALACIGMRANIDLKLTLIKHKPIESKNFKRIRGDLTSAVMPDIFTAAFLVRLNNSGRPHLSGHA